MKKGYKYLTEADFPKDDPVLIWKANHWYRPDNRGYSDDLLHAGLYNREEALASCFSGLEGQPKENGSCGVYAVPLREALKERNYTRKGLLQIIVRAQTLMKYIERTPDVHTEQCKDHGCKYNDPACTVNSGEQPQMYDCEKCEEDICPECGSDI